MGMNKKLLQHLKCKSKLASLMITPADYCKWRKQTFSIWQSTCKYSLYLGLLAELHCSTVMWRKKCQLASCLLKLTVPIYCNVNTLTEEEIATTDKLNFQPLSSCKSQTSMPYYKLQTYYIPPISKEHTAK